MPMWAILLGVWIVGIPVAYVVMDKVDTGWMRRWKWAEDKIARERKAYRNERACVSVGSWFVLLGVIKHEIADRKRSAALAKAINDLAELRQHIERMDWK